jgi:hypothetical protein
MAKISQRQVLAKVIPLSGKGGQDLTANNTKFSSATRPYFSQVSGGEIQASVEKVYDGGSTFPEVLPSVIEVGDVTVTRHYDPSSDAQVISYYRDKVGKQFFRVEILTLDADGNQTGYTRKYEDCILVNITEPDGDASSGGPATFSLTFSVSKSTDVAYTGTPNPGAATVVA